MADEEGTGEQPPIGSAVAVVEQRHGKRTSAKNLASVTRTRISQYVREHISPREAEKIGQNRRNQTPNTPTSLAPREIRRPVSALQFQNEFEVDAQPAASHSNDEKPWCRICDRIANAISELLSQEAYSKDDQKKVALNYVEESTGANETCETCARIADEIGYYNGESSNGMGNRIWGPECNVVLKRLNDKRKKAITCAFNTGTGTIGSFSLERGCDWGPSWIDLRRLKNWITNCTDHHGDKCHWSEAIHQPKYLTLIDVNNLCLSSVSLPTIYATLSYVWGKRDQTLETTSGNVEQLRKPNALKNLDGLPPLPTTIQDAIRLASGLGIPYLWVDRLCIVQNDSHSKATHIQAMGSIYHHSSITIIAADGSDANHGIRGAPGGTYPRNSGFLESRRYRFSPTCNMVLGRNSMDPLPTYREYGKNQIYWNNRAWTFQERILSRRNIIFYRGTVFWECLAGLAFEECVEDSKEAMERERGPYARLLPLNPNRRPDLAMLSSLVSEYNNRSLTFEEDALDAFTAILNSLSITFEGGFVFGLADAFFDICLLWQPRGALRRREVRDPQHGNYKLPSWSWIGWKGKIDPEWAYVHGFIGLIASHKAIYPLVDWFKINIDSGDRHQISNSYQRDLQALHGGNDPLLKSWHEFVIKDKPSRDYQTSFDNAGARRPNNFFHEDIPATRFGSLALIQKQPLVPTINSWSPHLLFRTKRSYLRLGPSMQRSGLSFEGRYLLHDAHGEFAGSLVLNEEIELKSRVNLVCELVAISKGIAWLSWQAGYCVGGPPPELLDRMYLLQDTGYYVYYNVLWIEWKDGISYRKGVGRVWKPKWESLNLEEIDVVLG